MGTIVPSEKTFNTALSKLKRNAFQDYAKSEGKLGGQNKIPRLANDRKIGDFLSSFKI